MKKETNALFISVVVTAIYVFLLVIGVKGTYRILQVTSQLKEAFDEENRVTAIMELSELRGRVKEVEEIYNSSACNTDKIRSELWKEIEDITCFEGNTNPYLEEFKISFNSSMMDDICEKIISQIDEQIHIIRYGTEDA